MKLAPGPPKERIMKKFISGLVLIFFCSTSFAGEQASFKRAVDTLNYRLTVEWDQKNKAARDQYVEEFKSSVEALRTKGMTDAEMQNSVLTLIKDPELKKQLLLRQGEISKLKSTDDVMKYVLSHQDQFSTQGASYSGGQIVATVAIGLVVAAFITVIVVAIVDANRWVCTKYQPKEVCRYIDSCNSYETNSYYDGEGNFTGYEETCTSYSTHQDCNTENQCVDGYYRD